MEGHFDVDEGLNYAVVQIVEHSKIIEERNLKS